MDSRLGKLRSQAQEQAGRTSCSWSGRFEVDGQSEMCWVTLPGDGVSPRHSLLEAVKGVLDRLNEVFEKGEIELKKVGSRSITDYRLHSVSVWDEVDELLLLEICPREYAPSEESLNLEFVWPGSDEFMNHRVKVRPTLQQLQSPSGKPAP